MENFFLEVGVTIYFPNLVSKSSPPRVGTNFFSRACRIFSLQTKRVVCVPKDGQIESLNIGCCWLVFGRLMWRICHVDFIGPMCLKKGVCGRLLFRL